VSGFWQSLIGRPMLRGKIKKGVRVVLSTIADGIWRQVETVQDTVSETFFEPVIRLGVTGLARSGKTVFITSLVANLLDRGRMPGLLAAHEGRIEAAFLQPQPDDTLPRFDQSCACRCGCGRRACWPDCRGRARSIWIL